MPWTFVERRRKNATIELSFFSLVQDIFSLFFRLIFLTKKGEMIFRFCASYFFIKITAPTNATAMITAIAAPIMVHV